jgi:hypothetical protein
LAAGITGGFIELVPFKRMAHVERMHLPDPTPGNHIETREAMLAAGMECAMEVSYARFEEQFKGNLKSSRSFHC